MISAVLLDLDGLLADTESLHCRTWQATLGEHDIAVTAEFYFNWWVRQGRGIKDFVQARRLALDPMCLRAEKAAHYARLVETCCTPMPGALELLDRLHGQKMLALASGSSAEAVRAVLGKLGIANRFAAIVTGSDVQRGKPSPAVFLLAARKLGVEPGQCVVLEDAEKGVLAAKAAGMKCIAVPSYYTADNDFSQANLVVPSLDEIRMGVIEAL
jgi:HAD superfamily hydrolase (TIGR01509 family)